MSKTQTQMGDDQQSKQTVFEKSFRVYDEDYGIESRYNLKQLEVLFPILKKGTKIRIEVEN